MAERTTWEQPPSAVRRSEAPLFLHATIVELRSTGQPGGGCPRVVFASPFHRSMGHFGTLACAGRWFFVAFPVCPV